ncbi:hypothetical protein ScPMuIL_011007 [Solemya velum]
MSDSEIATFVFLDLETTGLIREGKPAPSVTELCMVAVQREDMLKTVYPRVLNNFVLCFNPGEAKLSTEAKQLTGLTNTCLQEQKKFDKSAMNVINSFLRRLRGPVCLLAHNGNEFDFRLLVAESQNAGKPFLEPLLCADTLEAFRSTRKRNSAGARQSFALGRIYQREIGRPSPSCHNAAADVKTLIEVSQKMPSEFVSWVDDHAVPFSSITAP